MVLYCRRHCRGFTLLEILITVVVLSTGLVLVLQGLHGVLHVWRGGVQRTRAVMASQERFARVRHDAVTGVVPQSDRYLAVRESIEGRSGLYLVSYRSDAALSWDEAEYEMLVYVAPAQEDKP